MTDGTTAKTPTCIGIIVDGNRRWAKARGRPTLSGHTKGSENLVRIARWARDRGIKHAAAYIFSTENWNRRKEEVSYLMNLFLNVALTYLRDLVEEGMRIRFVGERARLSPRLVATMESLEKDSETHSSLTLWICLSYAGRLEIVEAARRAAEHGPPITEESFASCLWTAEMPDPDIIIRTSGEKRLSGFLTWKSVYSELFFIDDHWPAITEAHLDTILAEYASRKRRMGK